MKIFLLLLFLATTSGTFAQQAEYSKADSLARTIKKSDHQTPQEVASALAKNLKTDREKARAIFAWLAENVRYDLKGTDRDPVRAANKDEIRKIKTEMALKAFKKGKGVCEDYSRLFEAMATAVGLEAVFIGGNASTSVLGGWGSHAWNAVKIDGKWELLDATWGAGSVDAEDGKFRQRFQPGFFCTPPRLFAMNHFPDDPKWQLLETPLDKKTFISQPVSIDYGRWGISDVEPLDAPLKRDADDKVEIRLKMAAPPPVMVIQIGGRTVPSKNSEKDGWVSLRFSAKNLRDVKVWGGEDLSKTSLIAVFD